jgi:hypothetical protein
LFDALAEKLGADPVNRYTIVMEDSAEQTVEAEDWIVRGDFVAFGNALGSNRPIIRFAVKTAKILLIRLDGQT